MKKIWTQIIYNLRKDKSSYISFGIIMLFTALMLNIAFVLLFQVDKAYEEKFEKLHTATINVCIPKGYDSEQLLEEISLLEGVNEVEYREAVYMEAVVKEFRGTDFSMNTVFYNMDASRDINLLEVKESGHAEPEKSVYLPVYVSSFGEFKVGDKITYEIQGKAYEFVVAGVVEEMQYGNYGNGLMGAYLSKEAYEAFAGQQADNIVEEYSIITEADADLESVKSKVDDILNKQGIVQLSGNDSESVKATRTMVCNLMILILLAFACIVLLVSGFLCKFRISNTIEEEMANMGVLKAIGYTGNMIVGSMVLPYVITTVAATFMGVAISYAILPVLTQVLTLQSGFSFTLGFDVMGMLCVELLLVGLVALIAYGASGRIKKLQPINAMRGNVEGRRVKKNYFPLAETPGKTSGLLILKQITGCGKQNILLFFVSFVLTVLVAFAATMFYNVVIKPDNFMTTLSEETAEAVFYPEKGYQESLEHYLENDSRVEKVLKYVITAVKIDEEPVTAFVCEEFSQVSNDLCYLGENPDADNEIALGSAFEGEYKVGDTIKIKNGDISCTYVVTGFVQSVNYQGNVCELTIEGYEALTGEDSISSLYVYLTEPSDTEELIDEITKNCDDMIESVINSRQMSETSREMYAGIAMILVAVIFIVTMLIVLFILYIVIKSLIVRRRQELGIYKAMGYSNRQLVAQTVGGFMPAPILAIILSSAAGLIYMPYINTFIFQTIGAMKNNMEVSFIFLLIFGLLQIAVNLIISICLSMSIRKISAYSLIKE